MLVNIEVLACNMLYATGGSSLVKVYWFDTWPRCSKTFFMLNSTEHELYPVLKCLNANNCWHFNIYEQDKFRAQLR